MKNRKEARPLEYYLEMNYPFTIYRAEEGGYVGEIEDLPGCITEGDTLEEVLQRIEDARRAWIEVAYEDGMEIPLPRTEQEYSGRFIVRIPKYLHRRLAEQATREGVSLNQYVETILSAGASIHHTNVDKIIIEVKKLQKQIVDCTKPKVGFPIYYPTTKWATFQEDVSIKSDELKEIEELEPIAA